MNPLDAEFHQRVKHLFAEVVDLPLSGQARRLAERCGGDERLRREVESLLSHEASPRVDVQAGGDSLRELLADAAEEGLLLSGQVPPERIGEYVILEVLGEGGMGVVYLAEARSPKRTVALKVMRPGLAGRSVMRRFRRESEILGRLQHPNIAQIFASGTEALETPRGTLLVPFFAMEFVRGISIAEYCRVHSASVRERVALMIKVCEAIAHAHAAGVLHRDLKPANILVDERGEPKILDFGIARFTEGSEAATTLRTEIGQVLGTLPYMSPEQVSGRPESIDERSDVYALGVVLYELLAGRHPLDLDAQGIAESIRVILEQDPRALGTLDRSLRGDLDTIVGKCLDKRPEGRYQSVRHLADDLARHLDHRPIEARPPSAMYQVAKFARRNKPLVAGVVVAFVAMILATAGSLWFAFDAIDARKEAERQLEVSQRETARSVQSFALLSSIIKGANPASGGSGQMTVLEMLDRGTASIEADPGDVPNITGMTLRIIGATYFQLGELAKAERVQRRAIELLRQTVELGDRELVFTLVEFSRTLAELSKFDEAAAAVEEAVARRRRTTPEGTADGALASTLNDLGLLRMELGQFDAAEESLLESLRMREALGQGESHAALIALVNLGSTYLLSGRYTEAEPIQRRALAAQIKLLGESHPNALQAANNLAVTLRYRGRLAEALAMAQRVVELRSAVLPPTHFEVASGHANVGTIALLCGDFALAEPALRHGLEVRIAQLGPDHVDTARNRVVLASLLTRTGRLDEAGAELALAMPAMLAKYGEAHPRVADAHLELARLANARGDGAEARAETDAAIASAGGPDATQVSIGLALAEKALASWRMGEVDAARAEFATAMAWQERVLGVDHPDLADTRCASAALTICRGARGDTTSAELIQATREADDAAKVFEAALPAVTWRPALARLLAARLRALTATSVETARPHQRVATESLKTMDATLPRRPWWIEELPPSPTETSVEPR